jgi:hypothetical protein
VTFSPQFERIWLESKKRLPAYVSQKPATLELRSQYSIRFYDWVKKYVEVGTKTISLEELPRVLGLESVNDAEGNVIHEAPNQLHAKTLFETVAQGFCVTMLPLSCSSVGLRSIAWSVPIAHGDQYTEQI